MPYRDPEKRSEYGRMYRQKKKAGIPAKKPKSLRKCYICLEFPSLCVKSGVWFRNGFLVTDDPEIQRMIEGRADYGQLIFCMRVEP